jgi:hypothetical protein
MIGSTELIRRSGHAGSNGGFIYVTKLFVERFERSVRFEFVALSWHGFHTCERAGGRADGEEGR